MSGAWSIPHPEKANSLGADSYFHSREGNSVGVADGVGEWEWRFKCNPKGFADELMSGSEAAIRELHASSEAPSGPEETALAAMRRAYDGARSFGSSTALVASLDSEQGLLGIANLGDSSLVVLRSERVGLLLRWRVAARTKEQQHSFNCPFQLSCMPTPQDFPKLIAEGKQALVRVIQRNPNAQMDIPEDADRYTFQVQEGDLIVLGTDGVFDNLHLDDICELASRTITPFEARQGFDSRSCTLEATSGRPSTCPGRIARALAEAALVRSRDTHVKSPFSQHAQKAGLYHVGGKMDDITCVCAWVARTKSA
jgi:serine/threonine protein phosphatase PrpC